MKRIKMKSLLSGLVLSVCLSASAQNVKDQLSVPAINFGSQTFKLSGTQHPGNNHYKQIYLPNNEKQNNFNSMIQIEVVYGEDSVQNIFQQKINELESLKKKDKLCDYTTVKNPDTGEYQINFTSSYEKNKKTSLVEWNSYRYKVISGQDGTNGIILFAITKRASGKNCTAFIEEIKSNRENWTSSIKNFNLPNIKPIE